MASSVPAPDPVRAPTGDSAPDGEQAPPESFGGVDTQPAAADGRRTDTAAEWVGNLYVQRALAAGMSACIAYALARMLLVAQVPAATAIGVSVMAVLTFGGALVLGGREHGRHYRRYGEYGPRDWLMLLVPLLLGLRFLPYLWLGPAALAQDVQQWIDHPPSFVDITLFFSVLALLLVWAQGLQVAEYLQQLSLQPGEIAPPTSSPQYYDWLTSPYRFIDHAGAWRSLMGRFLLGGVVLLVLTGLVTVRPDQLANPNRPVVQGSMPPVLIYFLLGLLLASQTSLDRLRTEWLRDRAAIQPGLTARWLAASTVLLLLALTAAVLLPTGYSELVADQLPGLWRVLWPVAFAVNSLFRLVDLLFGVLLGILFAPIAALLPSGGGREPSAPLPAPEATIAPTPEPTQASYPSPLARVAFMLLFWGVPAAFAIWALWNTWRKRHEIWWLLRGGWREIVRGVVGGLKEVLRWLLGLFGTRVPGVFRVGWVRRFALQPRRRRGGGRGGVVSGGLRSLRGLDPRRLIWYLYISLVQRAAQLGWGRRRSDTAYEYSRRLAALMPEHQRAIDDLTAAYVRARYGRYDVTRAEAERAKGPWRAIRGALQHRRRRRLLGLDWLLGEPDRQ